MLINNYVNIAIITFNRLEFTKQAIASIVKHTKYPYVITVVDNGSNDGTQEYLKELQQTGIIKNCILLTTNIGVAKASNLAWLQEAEALYYLKYDNDIVIQKSNWLSALVSVIDSIPEIGVIGYNFEPVSYPLKIFNGCAIRVKEEGNIGGACFLIPKRTHEILGYWCEEYGLYGFEDVDYSFRVALKGLLNAYMEDENIGIHLPAGKAPLIDGITWRASDGIEEFKYEKYRNFKDLQLRDAINTGIIKKKFDDYLSKKCSLYISTSVSQSSINLDIQKFKKVSQNELPRSIYQTSFKALRIDLGCGINKSDNFIGVDICPGQGVDIVADLNKPFPFDDNSVDEVKAHDIIEHLQDRIHTMNEIWRVCKPGAKVDIRVPSTDGRGAFQDPTHISFWNINSFLYYCNDFQAYLALCRRYGFQGEFKAVQLEHEESPGGVIHVKAELCVIKPVSDLSKKKITENAVFKLTQQDQQKMQKQFIPEPNVCDRDREKEIFYPLSMNVQQYQKEPISCTAIANLRQFRSQIAKQLLSVLDDEIENMYLGEVGRVHQILLNSGIKNELLTITEQSFVDELVQKLFRGLEQPRAIQYLLAAMLYCHANQLPLQYDLSPIPHWFLKDYLQFLFSSPIYFQKLGEADDYYQYIQGWINYLSTSIFSNLDSPFWCEVVNNYAQVANFIPVYFNELNLKDIYVKRAEILEFFLKINRCEVNYAFTERPVNRKKIRIGILATHFTPGSETFAYLPVYEYISRDFEVILYSLKETGHPLEEYCCSCANTYKLLPQNLSAQVNIIRADDLDILFIATNVTAVTNQICLLVMHRLARIQVTSGGSVVTTGIRHIDYYISGTLTDPSPTAQEQYREKLVKIEGSAHCFSYGNEQGKETFKVERENLGISEHTVVFISGANFFKIIPELIETWAKIIAGVSNSVLVLLPFGPNWSNTYPKKAFKNDLSKVFSKYEISVERLIVLDPQPVPDREDVKEYFKIADIYLDSYPFAGTTSLVEPLQVNLPVVARKGNSFRSVMGAAMVQSLDIPGLVADSEESYIRLAIALGTNPELRQEKSAQIKERMQANPRFLDSRSYSTQMGEIFQKLFYKYQAEALTENFKLRETNLIIFPDWNQPEEVLYEDLARVITSLVNHPDKTQITLLIHQGDLAEEEANLLLADITMNLLLEEDLDAADGPEISLVGQISEIQGKALIQRLQARIVLEHENKEAITQVKAENIPSCELDKYC